MKCTKQKRSAVDSSLAPKKIEQVYDLIKQRGIELSERSSKFLKNYTFRTDTRITEQKDGIEIFTYNSGTHSVLFIQQDGNFHGELSLCGSF